MLRAAVSTVVVLLALGAASFPAAGKDLPQTGSTQVIALDDNASQLREDFNRAKGSVRLLLIVDPICPTCLRGMADVDAALLGKTRDPRLQTFIVHMPVIGAKATDVMPATELLHNPNVHTYWNASGNFGRLAGNALQLRQGDKAVYAWDVWIVYGPDAVWQSGPPTPALLMHQLPTLPRQQFLDADAFAATAQALLNQLPARAKAN